MANRISKESVNAPLKCNRFSRRDGRIRVPNLAEHSSRDQSPALFAGFGMTRGFYASTSSSPSLMRITMIAVKRHPGVEGFQLTDASCLSRSSFYVAAFFGVPLLKKRYRPTSMQSLIDFRCYSPSSHEKSPQRRARYDDRTLLRADRLERS